MPGKYQGSLFCKRGIFDFPLACGRRHGAVQGLPRHRRIREITVRRTATPYRRINYESWDDAFRARPAE